MSDNKFSVMDMMNDYADEHEIDPAEIFRKHPVSGNVKREFDEETKEEPQEEAPVKKEKKAWMPDPKLTEGMSEFNQPGAVYDKDEVKLTEDKMLHNIADDMAVQESRESMDDMNRKLANIEEAKQRHNIKNLHIPPGNEQVRMLICAGDTDHKRAQEGLDKILEEIKEIYPSFIEYNEEVQSTESEIIEEDNASEITEENTENVVGTPSAEPIKPKMVVGDSIEGIDTKIVIDKRNLDQVAWSQEEVDKIKKSRTIELNIVEGSDLEFGSIQEADTSNIDALLSQYERKSNDVVAALPASKYRATFTGLTYPEVIDLSSSNEMNTLDGERKKWSIAFNHIKNQSIGAWEEYLLYKDPKTKKIVKSPVGVELPDYVPDAIVHHVTKFEDFLRKTSFMDLEFILWKILCATAMDKEVVSIDCHSKGNNGKECGHSYDWIYSPSELLSMDTISPTVLEEMKETGEASTTEEIMRVYKTSPVASNDFVTLHTSGFKAVYGHISAYEYLDSIYSKMKELENPKNIDPSIVSRGMSYATLSTIKAFIIEDKITGINHRITGADNLVKVLDTLDEVDWQTISEITRLMLEPYQFRFSLRDIVCPKCKNRSMIPIDSMTRLLFIVARSLSSVQVTLKRI